MNVAEEGEASTNKAVINTNEENIQIKLESRMPKKYTLIGGVIVTLAITVLVALSYQKYDSINPNVLSSKHDGSSSIQISSYPLYENHPEDTFAQFLNFIAQYSKDKEYRTEEEFNKRLGIFSKNYDRIVKYNRMEDAGFTLEINQFADLEDDEFVAKHANGVVVSQERRRRVEEQGPVEPDSEDVEENTDEDEGNSVV